MLTHLSTQDPKEPHDAANGLSSACSCVRCGFMSSQSVCKACILLEGLNKGLPHLGTQRTRGKGKNTVQQAIAIKLEDEQSAAADRVTILPAADSLMNKRQAAEAGAGSAAAPVAPDVDAGS